MPEPLRSSLAPEQIPAPIRMVLVRLRDRLFEVDDGALPPLSRALFFVLRLLWLVVRSFFRDRLQIRAASLSFSTVLAIVPALALVFALARASGLYAELRAETIDPFLDEMLAPSGAERSPGVVALRSTADGVLLLVDETNLSGLGIAGVVVLVLALLRVVRGVEEAFRHVFSHRGPMKPLHLRIRAFAIALIVTPMGLLYSVTTASLAHGTRTMGFLREWVPYPPLQGLILFFLPPVVTTLALYVLYVELPQGAIRRRAALFGAVLAALAWYGLQLAHVRLQLGLAHWNAIYSGFGAFPVLLASIQASWVIVLIGAQLAAARDNAPSLRLLSRGAPPDHRSRQSLAIRVVTALAKAGGPMAARELAMTLTTDLRPMTEILDALESHDLVARIATKDGPRWAMKADADTVRAGDVLDAIEGTPPGELPWDDQDPAVRAMLLGRREAANTSGHNLTIAQLAGRRPEEKPPADETITDPPASP